MTFLPIVERELRVAARRHYTYWSRLVGAGFILVIFGCILSTTMFSAGAGAMPWTLGQMEFSTLKWIAFAFACSAGVHLTSDSLSEEKRDGTLGLLFLTDLRGHDVVLGKLMSHSLQAFYGLLAAFPILALPLLMGGVTGTEFGHSILIICNTLFFSLTAGMMISSISREAVKAMNGVLGVLLIFLLILPWIDLGIAGNISKFQPILSHASPGYLFAEESYLAPRDFWTDFGFQHFLGWAFLAFASLVLPRSWQEKSASQKGPRQSLMNRWRFGGQRARVALRRKFLDRNPILWLALRDRWLARFIWLVMAVVAGLFAWQMYFYRDNSGINLQNIVHVVFVVGMWLWITSQACRLFSEAVHNGAMELILVTPINPREIVQGQLRALWRTFRIPALFVVALSSATAVETILLMLRNSPTTVSTIGFNWFHYQIFGLVSSIITTLLSFAALAWFGAWMGLTNRKTSVAMVKTICFVSLLPWFVEVFVQIAGMGILMKLLGPAFARNWPFWFNALPSTFLEIGKSIFFIVWSRRQLLAHFREAAVRSGQSTIARSRRRILVAPLLNP